ncbi:MAG: hypothetical protein EAZ08_07515 [Cytophagales bacterium]|nr:MAG: hypothetical protein EAZ08_07515 [Cytophagales bacterium]
MKRINQFVFLVFLFLQIGTFARGVFAQILTFHDDIAPIIHTNCTPCHQQGGVAPFSLISYEDVSKRGKFVTQVTQSRYMPPWKADHEFRSFLNERILAQEDINKIKNWVESGMKEGKKRKDKKEPIGAPLPKPDLVLTMTKPYNLPADNSEDFRFFSIPTNLPKDTYISAVEFVAGNKQRVHHSRVMIDSTNKIRGIDGISEADPAVYKFQTVPLADEFMYGWVPGNLPVFFPEGIGKKLPKNADLILNMHYAPSPLKETDQSTVRFYFAKTKVNREVKTFILKEDAISNQPFFLPANTKSTFYMSSGAIDKDMSLLSIQPHAHVLGKSFKAFAITPDGDMIPLIKIDNWDFNWQTTYQFKTLTHVPKGSVIMVEGTYDNTAGNPENPNRPPKGVGYGWRTVDEMMNLIIYYVDYQQGDENISMEKR